MLKIALCSPGKDALDEAESERIRVEQAFGALDEPLSVSEECLAYRNQRQGTDRVDDNVQKHLNFEVDTIKNSQVRN